MLELLPYSSRMERGDGFRKVYLTGGLGNQLFQLSAGLNQYKGKITFLVDKTSPRLLMDGTTVLESLLKSQRDDEFSQQISFIYSIFIRLIMRQAPNPQSTMSGKILAKTSKVLLGFFESLKYRRNVRVVAPEAIGYVGPSNFKSSIWIGYFQSEEITDSALISQLLNRYAELNHSDFYEEMSKKTESRPLIVHVRLGDYIGESRFGIPGREYYQSAIREALKVVKVTEIWLFSDEIDDAIEHIGLIEEIPIVRMDHSETDPLAVLNVMRLGVAYVIGNSTFAWWAAHTSRSDSPITVAPAKWFSNMKDPVGLINRDWIRLDPNFER